MFQAKAVMLGHTTNTSLASIRYMELMVVVNFFSSVGWQSLLMASYEINQLSQIAANSGTYEDTTYFFYIYWVLSTIGIAIGFLGVLVSLFVSVFGQALALRGPVGSMIRAINYMKPYQLFVVGLFTTNIFFLVVSTLFQAGIYMTPLSFVITTVMVLVGMNTVRAWLLDIYNLFNFPGLFRNAIDVDEEAWRADRRASYESFDGMVGARGGSVSSRSSRGTRASDRSVGHSFDHIVGDADAAAAASNYRRKKWFFFQKSYF